MPWTPRPRPTSEAEAVSRLLRGFEASEDEAATRRGGGGGGGAVAAAGTWSRRGPP